VPFVIRLLIPLVLAALVVFSAFSSPAHRGHGTHPVSRSLQIQR
jgi:hypothetical protein